MRSLRRGTPVGVRAKHSGRRPGRDRVFFRGRARDDTGAVAILVAALSVVLLTLAAIILDLGLARDVQARSQTAADVSALAAAQAMYGSSGTLDINAAVAAAKTYAVSNFGVSEADWSACTDANELSYVPAGGTPCISFDSSTAPTKVRVRIPTRDVITAFAGVTGVDDIPVATRAVAQVKPASRCALCVLKTTGTTLSATGAGSMTVNGGSIAVNSSDSKAASITNPSGGGFTVSPAPPNTISMVGGYQQAATGQLSPTPTTGTAPAPDPLASLPVPLPCAAPGALAAPDCVLGNQTSVNVSGSADKTLSPGVYSSIKSSSTGTLTMQPGIYVITSTLTLNKSPAPGKTSLVAPGVLLYFACSAYPTPCAATGASGADFSMSGGATVSISSPTSGSWQGVSVFFDRTNTTTLKLTGSSASSVSGSIYLKSGGTTLTGSSGVFILNSLIVTATLTKTGDSGIGISFDPDYNVPGLNGRVHLIE